MSYKLAMDVFHLSKSFPKEEKHALTDQVRRSSRSVFANIAEGYRKRQYPKHFALKLTDADGKASETTVTWISPGTVVISLQIFMILCCGDIYKSAECSEP